ncbi:DUF2235 domain-containing protein [Rhodobacteraceae bacterium CCMM004]|nr:DUF2235 domain-containing protein [Rhodobacteraceae bacterium CCMM004]
MRPLGTLRRWLSRVLRWEQTPEAPRRGPVTHVILLDGTMSSLLPGCESNVGLTWRLVAAMGSRPDLSLRYESGIQWTRWSDLRDVIEGRGINRQIRRTYGYLASRYRPGDRIFLLGYSRGAFAVRSLAGVIDRVGLLRPEHAIERNVSLAYRHYRGATSPAASAAFRAAHCYPDVPIDFVGCWDTVKALGLRLPLLWRLSRFEHDFHDHDLGLSVRIARHALAMDETRNAYAPVMWTVPEGYGGDCRQMWFRGTHGDVGGQIDGRDDVRPLSNIPLVWMLDEAEAAGLPLPPGWRAGFPQDPDAPSVGGFSGWSKMFLSRRRRPRLRDPSEALHPSAVAAPAGTAALTGAS